jgi:hypothetical protein
MKARFTFVLLSVAIIALLGVSAWFTMKIFDTNLVESEFTPVAPKVPEDISITHEEDVTVKPQPAKSTPRTNVPKTTARPPKVASHKPAKSEPLPDYAGVISQISGVAYRNKASGSRFKLSVNDKIFVTDHIETDKDSTLLIVFIDSTRLSLGEKTSCVIDDFMFDKSAKTDSGFGLRLIQGACRVVTGLITTLNPDRFRVETRMATIGIRGCELAFQATPEEEKIYVMGLNSKEAVVVSSTSDGTPVRDIHTGKPIANAKVSPILVKDQGMVVTVSKGLGASARPMSPGELRGITTVTTPLSSVKHSANVQPNSTVFVITPQKRDRGATEQ